MTAPPSFFWKSSQPRGALLQGQGMGAEVVGREGVVVEQERQDLVAPPADVCLARVYRFSR